MIPQYPARAQDNTGYVSLTMMRLITLWIAVSSLVGIGLASVASSVARLFGGSSTGWTYYTPYSTTTVLPLSMQVVDFCSTLMMFLVPLAALSSAAFMVLLERQVRRSSVRGFAVGVAGQSLGT